MGGGREDMYLHVFTIFELDYIGIRGLIDKYNMDSTDKQTTFLGCHLDNAWNCPALNSTPMSCGYSLGPIDGIQNWFV